MSIAKSVRILASSLRKAVREGEFPDTLPRVCATTRIDRDGAEKLGSFLGAEVDDCAPPALLRALCFGPTVDLLSGPGVPVPAAGMVVSDQSWELHAPVSIAAEVEVGVELVSVRRDARGTRLLVRGRVAHRDELVYEETTAYAAEKATGTPLSLGEPWDFQTIDHRRRFGLNPSGRLDTGQTAALASRAFGAIDSRRWARFTGDRNPIHISVVAAKAFGYRRPILHGAVVDAWAAHSLGLDGSRPCAGRALFRAPVLLPASLELVALGTRDFAVLDERSGRDLVHLAFSGASEGSAPRGLVLPRDDGRATSTLVSRGMAAAAAARFPEVRTAIESAVPWRRKYRDAMTSLSAWDAPEKGATGARDGLAFLHETVRFADGRASSQARIDGHVGRGDVVEGTGSRVRELRIPIDGEDLGGDALIEVLRGWQEKARMRPAAVEAISDVVADPGILDLEGWTFACLGAGAELSPAGSLLSWGADVAAVARSPLPELVSAASASAGRLHLPPEPLDVVADPERTAGWIANLPGRVAIVDTLYAPGARFLLAAVGADVVERLVCRARPDTALAWYGSPSDAYLLGVPTAESIGTGPAAVALAGLAKLRRARPSRRQGVYAGFIDVQGPNYAAAKRIGRWRATVEREAGRAVSYNVGPLSATRSVLGARALRAAYGGLSRLGMPGLPPATSAALMAALLAWDLEHPGAVASSESFMTDKAVDCGLFACPYEPNALMGIAVALGADKGLRGS